jgi:uroporphyrin-III C-methyltransferase
MPLFQAEIDAEVIAAATAGKNVVRLKGGDPFVFGRGGEEIELYRKHGFDPELIPGISSCIAGGRTLIFLQCCTGRPSSLWHTL